MTTKVSTSYAGASHNDSEECTAQCCGVLITASLDDPNNPLGSPNGQPGLLAQRAVGPLTAVKQLFRLTGVEENSNWHMYVHIHILYHNAWAFPLMW